VAQGTQIPLHLGSLNGGVAALLERVPVDRIRAGDVFICNDPYLANGTHLPDITIITPVFCAGRLEFFAANIGHHADVGGAVPGSIAGGSRSVFEEGIRLPVTRICKAGELDAELLELIAANTRDPEERKLDLQVQIATNDCGVREARELMRQMGAEAVRAAIDDVIEYTRRRMRNRIAELTAGEYTFTNYLDDDGMGGDPVPIQWGEAEGRLQRFWRSSARRDECPGQRIAGMRLLLGESLARPGASAERGSVRRRQDSCPARDDRQSAAAGGGRRTFDHVPENLRGNLRCVSHTPSPATRHGLGQRCYSCDRFFRRSGASAGLLCVPGNPRRGIGCALRV
jgi:hypothetical protein